MRELDDLPTVLTGPTRRRSGAGVSFPPSLLRTAAAARHPKGAGKAAAVQLQRKAGNAATLQLLREEQPSPVHDVVSSGGEPLDRDARVDMESTLGQDFSDVRIHRDSAAHESAQAVEAKAYTVGSHVVFQRDSYDPSSDDGRHTLAHELTHVVQQRSGPVDGTEAPGGIRVSDPSDRFEREASAAADSAMERQPAPVAISAEGAVQREDETAQTYVQREELEEEPEGLQAYVQPQASDAEEEEFA